MKGRYEIEEIPTPAAMDWIKTPTIWQVSKDGSAVATSRTQDEARKTLSKHQTWDAEAESKREKNAGSAAIRLQAATLQREERQASGIMADCVSATTETRPANDSFYLEDEERY